MADQTQIDYAIKPEAVAPAIPTSEWPLLLKNYDKRMSFILMNPESRLETSLFEHAACFLA